MKCCFCDTESSLEICAECRDAFLNIRRGRVSVPPPGASSVPVTGVPNQDSQPLVEDDMEESDFDLSDDDSVGEEEEEVVLEEHGVNLLQKLQEPFVVPNVRWQSMVTNTQ